MIAYFRLLDVEGTRSRSTRDFLSHQATAQAGYFQRIADINESSGRAATELNERPLGSGASHSKSRHDIGDIGRGVLPVRRRESATMATGHGNREQDRLVVRVTDAFEAVHLVDPDTLGGRPAATSVAADAAVTDRQLLGPTGVVQLAHPITERVHRPGHDAT
ncbi:MAG: hypothetical protein ACLGHQ_09615 [Acidimicrobiia bacterium]